MTISNIQQFQNTFVSYNDALKFKYTIAWDKDEKGTKWYNGFNSFVEYEDFLTATKRTNNRVFYEIIGSKCKAFFDFDKLIATKDQLTLFINNFVTKFNALFNLNITKSDLLIYYRHDNSDTITDIYTSIHISVIGYSFSKSQLFIAVNYFKLMITGMVSESMDNKIYTRNRPYNLPNNTKMKYLKEDTKNPRYFVDYQEQSTKPVDYLLSYTEMLPFQEIPKYHLFAISIVKIKSLYANNTNTLKNAFDKIKNFNKPIEPVVKREMVHIDNPVDLFDYLVLELPEKFYFASSDWKMLTTLLKKFGMTDDEFNIWNKTSIKYATKYLLENNKLFYENINLSMYRSGRYVFKTIVEKYLNIDIQYNYDNSLALWLQSKIPSMALDEIISIVENQKNVIIIQLGEDHKYASKSGYLMTSDDAILANYFAETQYKEIGNDRELNNVIKLDKIEDIAPYIKQFNEAIDYSILCVKAKWGAGKTHFVSREIINYAVANEQRIIFLTENNSLNKQIVKQFNSPDCEFVSHINQSAAEINKCLMIPLEKQQEIGQQTNNIINIACSTESIHKIQFRSNDVLILDEYESIMNHFESDTFSKKNFDKYMLFKNAIKTVNKVVILDADISNERVQLMEKITDMQITPIHALTDPFHDYKFNFIVDEKDLQTSINNSIFKNKKILIASSSKKYLNVLYNDLTVRFKDKVILKLCSEGVTINSLVKITKEDFLNDMENIIIKYKVDVFLYSPSIKTGISINSEYFHSCYAYGHNKSVCSRELIQMLFRARSLKDKTINISLNSNISFARSFVTTNKIFNYIVSPVYLLQTFKIFEDRDTPTNKEPLDYSEIIKYDDDFLKTKIINMYESYNSSTRFAQDFVIRMVYNHGIKLNYIGKVKAKYDDKKIDIEEEPDLTIEEFVNTRLITTTEFIKLDKLKNADDWQVKQKYKFFNHIYYIHGITHKLEYDVDVYDNINNADFYSKYLGSSVKSKYILTKAVLDYNIEDYKMSMSDNITNNSMYDNKFTQYEHKIGKEIITIKLLNEMSIDLNKLPLTMNNEEFNTMVSNFNYTGFQKELKYYYDNYTREHYHIFDINNTKYYKSMKIVIIELLGDAGISLKYINKHTTGKHDKFTISMNMFQSKQKQFIGRLKDIDVRVPDKLVKKRNNAFVDSDTNAKVYPNKIKKYNDTVCNNNTYYTRYLVKQTKAIKKISKVNELNTNNMNDNDVMLIVMNKKKEVFLEIMKYKQQQSRPRLITKKQYIENNIKLLNECDDMDVDE